MRRPTVLFRIVAFEAAFLLAVPLEHRRVEIQHGPKRPRLHGANAIIALRCAKLSGRLEDFWERRSAERSLAA